MFRRGTGTLQVGVQTEQRHEARFVTICTTTSVPFDPGLPSLGNFLPETHKHVRNVRASNSLQYCLRETENTSFPPMRDQLSILYY